MPNSITRESIAPLKPFKTVYLQLKEHGETALNDIHSLLEQIQNDKDNNDPLYPLEILKKKVNIIQFKYLGVNIYVRTRYNFEKIAGYIEWGTFEEEEEKATEFNEIHSDEYDKLGNLKKDFTGVDHAHVLLPEALKKIFDKIQKEDIYF